MVFCSLGDSRVSVVTAKPVPFSFVFGHVLLVIVSFLIPLIVLDCFATMGAFAFRRLGFLCGVGFYGQLGKYSHS